jgi:hypothetical protein
MSSAGQTFAVTPEQWAAVKEKVASLGFNITADSGKGDKDFTEVSWNYDGSGSLEIEAEGLFASKALGKISDLVKEVTG